MSGGKGFFGTLVYTGKEGTSLVPSNYGPKVLTIPVGNGFRFLMSRNSPLRSKRTRTSDPSSVRATRKAFRHIKDVATEDGFRLYDLVLSRGGQDIISVRNDAAISSEVYEKYSSDSTALPVHMSFRKEECTLSFSLDMTVTCSNYFRDAGSVIYDSFNGILSESSIYDELFQSFLTKHNDDWTAKISPVSIPGNFGERDEALANLESRLPIGLYVKPVRRSGIYFSHNSGLWGEMVCLKDAIKVYFMSVPDFNMGIEIIDALKEMVQV